MKPEKIQKSRSARAQELALKNEQHERNICYALCQAGHFMGEDLPTKLSKTAGMVYLFKRPKVTIFLNLHQNDQISLYRNSLQLEMHILEQFVKLLLHP